MEQIFVLFAVGLLAVVFGGAICGWVAVRELSKLRRTVATLQLQVQSLVRPNGPKPTREDTTRAAPIKPATATLTPVASPTKTAPKLTSDPSPWQTLKPAVKQPDKAKTAPKPKLDLETLLGAKGSVWIGGLALLLGAVFLLRYTIEAGMLTPMMRISVAILMGVAALGLSEWMARRDLKTPVGKALSAKADIPAILAAVGVFCLFGAVYTAHALYGLLTTTPTFFALAAIALGTMALSLRRGPWLAAIGLVGALTVPQLVASVTPSYLGVFAYVAIITGAALWVAKRQSWMWLRAAALVGATVWLTILLGKAVNDLQFGLWVIGIFAAMELTVRDITRAKTSKFMPQWTWLGWGGVFVLTALIMFAANDRPLFSYIIPFAIVLLMTGKTLRGNADRLWPLLLIGGGLFATIFTQQIDQADLSFTAGWIAAIVAAALFYILTILSVANRLTDDRGATGLTLIGGGIAALMLVGGIDMLTPYASKLDHWAGFSLAGLLAVATIMQNRLAVVRGVIWMAGPIWLLSSLGLQGLSVTSGLYSTGLAGIIALALLSKTGRDDIWVRLAVIVPAAATGLASVTAVQDSATYISTTPFLNELWLYFGLPGAIAAVGAVLFRRRREGLASQALLGGAIVFALLLIVLLIHHAMNGGDLTATPGFEDYAVQLLVAFAAMFGASWLRGGLTDWPKAGVESWRFIVPTLAIGASALSLLVFVVAQLLSFNPLLNAQTVIDGHPVFNSLLLGYLAPAILLGGAALRFSGHRPVWFVRTLGALAGVSWLVWTTAQIRRFASGELIAMDIVPWGNGELYAVSAVWLLTGIALLLSGMKTGRRDLRLASAGLITLTTLKVFLVDMSALDGAFRAISFIGLGIVLIGIGRLYQTVLTRPRTESYDDQENSTK